MSDGIKARISVEIRRSILTNVEGDLGLRISTILLEKIKKIKDNFIPVEGNFF